MESDIKIFEFEQHNVETIFLNDDPLFNPYDIGNCLDLKESSLKTYIRSMDDTERLDLKSIPENQKNNLKLFENSPRYWVREPGLYQLILKSRKPEAEKFTRWVTHELLPEIRKTGSYSLNRDDRILREIISNAENLLGIRKREIAINQNESWNMKLAKLIWDLSKEMGSTKSLYEELVYMFSEETGFNINELAESMGMTRQKYLIKNQSICKTLYEFALEHFYSNSRQVILVPSQTTLDKVIS